MQRVVIRWVAVLCFAVCAAVAGIGAWPKSPRVVAGDRNGDGRPDVWRYDRDHGRFTEVRIDSNFDGRSDIQEYYEGGVLVRREWDRNFDGQIDLVEEFDATTRLRTRSVVDVDYDGTADLLVLFRDGRPVFTQAHAVTTALPLGPGTAHDLLLAQRDGAGPLAQLTDPFRADTALRGRPVRAATADESVGLSTSGGLPAADADRVSPRSPSTPLGPVNDPPRARTALFTPSPRGPPPSRVPTP